MAFRLLANPSRLIIVISECLIIIFKNSPTGSAVYTNTLCHTHTHTHTLHRCLGFVSAAVHYIFKHYKNIIYARILCERSWCVYAVVRVYAYKREYYTTAFFIVKKNQHFRPNTDRADNCKKMLGGM